jgi:hypothetical protein
MNPGEPEPLWRTVVGDAEPWRRGRLFLVLLAVVTFCLQGLMLGLGIVAGDIVGVLILGIFALFFWLQYYFIWIGVHWVRWLNGGWNAVSGFVFIILGLRDKTTFGVAVGLYCLGTGVYLALAPSVYFFAKRQRETVRWMESLVIAATFLLLLGSLSAGVIGLLGYKAHLERKARAFADTALTRIFADHDTYFLLENATDRLLEAGGGQPGLSRFMQSAAMHAGDVHDIKPSAGSLRFSYSFPLRLSSEGQLSTEGIGDHGRRIRMYLNIGEVDGAWKIDAIWWSYF